MWQSFNDLVKLALKLVEYGFPTFKDIYSNDCCLYCGIKVNPILTRTGKIIPLNHSEECLWVQLVRIVRRLGGDVRVEPKAAKFTEERNLED